MTANADGMFGQSHEVLATLVGLVAMHAALLESDLESLASSIGDIRQDESAGIGIAGARSVIRETLAESYASDADAELRRQIGGLLDEADATLERRNLVVHGVWSVRQPGEWLVWKPKRRAKTTADWIESATFRATDFADLLETLRQLHEDAMAALNTAAAHHRVPSRAGRRALRSRSQIAPGRTV